MSNKKGRLEKYVVTLLESKGDLDVYAFQIQWFYHRKPVGNPVQLINEESVRALLLQFKKDCPKGRIDFVGLPTLEQKVKDGLPSKVSYDIQTTPVQSYG